MSRVVGSVQQIADAAYVYVGARQLANESDPAGIMLAQIQVDAALHDLTLCCGFPCECAEGTCEGLLLS